MSLIFPMTCSAVSEFILPDERNGYWPPANSKSLRKQEGGKVTRLKGLKRYLATAA